MESITETIKTPLLGTKKPTVGYYIVNGANARLRITVRPSIIHRFFCKVLLGWYWEDK